MTRCGYGRISIRVNGKTQKVRAHKYAYTLFHDEEIADRFVLHKCDTPLCVNPNHLFLGTHDENMADMKAKGRSTGIRSLFNHRMSEADRQIAADITIPVHEAARITGFCRSSIRRVRVLEAETEGRS